jgi:hypothetical protein
MPVTPSVAFTVPNIDQHIQKIDHYLSGEWDPYSRGNGKWYDSKGMTYGEREAVKQAYEKAGWNVELHDDQRDGPSIRFRPTP